MEKSREDDLRDQLREAAKKGNLTAVRKLLDRGVNPHWCDVDSYAAASLSPAAVPQRRR